MEYYLTCTIAEADVLKRHVRKLKGEYFSIKATDNPLCYIIKIYTPWEIFKITEIVEQEVIITTINPFDTHIPTIEIYDWKRE